VTSTFNQDYLGQILIKLGKLEDEKLQSALESQNRMSASERVPLGQILLDMGAIEPNDLIDAIREQQKLRSNNASS
jgi:hypothetical protein